jgi:hypothetical protein
MPYFWQVDCGSGFWSGGPEQLLAAQHWLQRTAGTVRVFVDLPELKGGPVKRVSAHDLGVNSQ